MKLCVLLITIFIGCSSSKNIDTKKEMNEKNNKVSFEILVEDQMGGFVKEETRVIRSHKELLQVYGYVNRMRKPGFSIPKIDFSKASVVAIFMGEKTTGGFSVTVESVMNKEGKVIVEVIETQPKSNDMATMAFTQPFCFVKINSIDKEIVFEK